MLASLGTVQPINLGFKAALLSRKILWKPNHNKVIRAFLVLCSLNHSKADLMRASFLLLFKLLLDWKHTAPHHTSSSAPQNKYVTRKAVLQEKTFQDGSQEFLEMAKPLHLTAGRYVDCALKLVQTDAQTSFSILTPMLFNSLAQYYLQVLIKLRLPRHKIKMETWLPITSYPLKRP